MKLFILTYNVFWKTLEGIGKKYYCENNSNDNKNCVKNLAKVIIYFSKKIARDNGIISEAVLDFIGLQESSGWKDICPKILGIWNNLHYVHGISGREDMITFYNKER